jgi:hypothetical protein
MNNRTPAPGAGLGLRSAYEIVCTGPDGQVKWAEIAFNRVVTEGLNKVLDAAFKTGLTSPAWYVGLVGPRVSDGAITSGDATLTSASNPFTSADVGSTVIVRGAGSAGADLVTTVASYTNAGSVELTANASTTVTGAKVCIDGRAADTMGSHASFVESTAYDESTRQALTPGSIASGAFSNSGAPATVTISTDGTLIGAVFVTDNSTKSGTTGTLMFVAPFTGGFKACDDGDTLTITATVTASSVAA